MKGIQLAALVGWVALAGCSTQEPVTATIPEEPKPVRVQIAELITEASGNADSRMNPGHLWVHEDSGKPALLYLLHHNGQLAHTLRLQGVPNRDWEDIALAGEYLYLADTGDNEQQYGTSIIYKFKEPDATIETVHDITQLQFRYPDGPHDTEALLVDEKTAEIYLLTKRDIPARIYKISAAPESKKVQIAELVGTLPLSGIVSATLSDKAIILKTYTGLYLYPRTPNEPISSTLQKNYTALPYEIEPQGEAVTFSVNGRGYYTLSEKLRSAPVNLYYYQLNR